MNELLYETIPDAVRVYPVYDDGFSTMEHSEANEKPWTAHITIPGEIKSLTDPDGKEYTAFEQLQALGIKALKVVCEHEVEIDHFMIEEPDVDDGIHDGRDFDEPYATEPEDRVFGI